jgi:DNA-binding transcriptional regulator YbjK
MKSAEGRSRTSQTRVRAHDDALRDEAVKRVLAGDSAPDVAASLGVGASTVRRWVAAHRSQNDAGDGRPSQPQTNAPSRQDLVDAAVRVVSRGGLRSLTYRSVAAEAGVSHGLVRHYFGNLDQLLVIATEDVVDRAMKSGGMYSSSSKISDFAAGLEVSVEEQEEIQSFISEMVVEARREPRIRPLVANMYSALRDSTQAQLQQRGLQTDSDLAVLVFAALDGLVFQQLALSDPATTSSALRKLREVLEVLERDQAGLDGPVSG